MRPGRDGTGEQAAAAGEREPTGHDRSQNEDARRRGNGIRDEERTEKRPKKPKPESKIAVVVRRWLGDVLPTLSFPSLSQGSALLAGAVEALVAQAPKHWVVYEPMVLLPTGSFGFSREGSTAVSEPAPEPVSALLSNTVSTMPCWQMVLAAVSPVQQDQLWCDILRALSPKKGSSGDGGADGHSTQLTHLAVNESIPLHVPVQVEDDLVDGGMGAGGANNVLRSPTGLRPLYGDFGPVDVAAPEPSEADFARAFWVSTKQNGLYQTWAPRWSMFSRGNIKEKARLLAWPETHGANAATAAASAAANTGAERAPWAVDLYAGIGYFVFSYARRGLRVLGWELNPWSAEALRRGAARNGWTVRVVRGAAALARPTADVVFGANGRGEDNAAPPQIVLFVEDNQKAARRLSELRAAHERAGRQKTAFSVVHVNCGLLPTSRPTWRTAWDAVVSGGRGRGGGIGQPWCGWLHLHENVGVADVDRERAALQALVDVWTAETTEATEATGEASARGTIRGRVEHVELVKTFAPGVWHCVFDVRVDGC
ncbi:tRNA wybutosine-synthesizing protein [Niveomyces insectorum RCEF 264]|uniref:tRNA(Phe) (4-demethylwyosine(37)-C(7)) aminocarboxypropyltransferase n=1 Tax=Niveomyces insectorum RCEF 264 TaxID=1081102 RepID=A0A167NQT1_9HYPO|nr:tRNA wybutosine-synthesizing protein [Niveomyces insectorum RCEF 264]